ncbi:flagellar export chaperone FliS [bacterium]|nr:flagellar export chaperone FliS [bacterium]
MAQGRPYQAYQNAQAQTSNQKQLIVMLYDGMDKFLTKAVQAINEGDIETAHSNLHRTGQIILELLGTLREDKGGEIATNLKQIYVYCYEQVVIGNLKKDVEMIRNVQQVINNLGSAWKQISQKKGNLRTGTDSYQQVRVSG